MHNAGQRPYHKRGIPLARVSRNSGGCFQNNPLRTQSSNGKVGEGQRNPLAAAQVRNSQALRVDPIVEMHIRARRCAAVPKDQAA